MEDVIDCCRLCLKRRGVKEDIFDEKPDQDSLAKLIHDFFGIELLALDHWPVKACTGCIKLLASLKELREKILATQHELFEILCKEQEVEVLPSTEEPGDILIQIEVEDSDSSPESSQSPQINPNTPKSRPRKTNRPPVVNRKPATTLSEEEKKAVDDEMRRRKLLFCHVCQETDWDTYQELRDHVRVVHKERTFIHCCDRKFNDTMTWQHMKYHLDEDVYKCSDCGKRCYTQVCLNYHRLKNHLSAEEATCSCEICGKLFKYQRDYQEHRVIHSKVKDFICDFCGKAFSRVALLKSHSIRNHQEKLSEPCHICGKQCFNLKKHIINSHTDQDKEPCNLCKKPVRSSYMKHHLRLHHSDARFNCSVCRKDFKTNSKLKAHLNIHLGIRLPCHFCQHTATNNGNLCTHMKQKHPVEYEEYKKKNMTTPLVKNPSTVKE